MIEKARLRELNGDAEHAGDYVLYWMQQAQRERFNPALETAVANANRLGLPTLVAFGLTDNYPEANLRHYSFMLEGLCDVEIALRRRGIGFIVLHGGPDDIALRLAKRAALVICDRGYLRHQRAWRTRLAKEAGRRVIQVEGDAVVPVDLVSEKQEIAARTLRPKLMRLRDEFIQPLRRSEVLFKADLLELPPSLDLSNPEALLGGLAIDGSVGRVKRFRGGAVEAARRLNAFIKSPLSDYAVGRREPARSKVSFLGAYLHFGHISPVEIAHAVANADAGYEDRRAYLEELIVRRELAINFVEHEARYDSYTCIPEWARRSLAVHERDPRPHRYDAAQLEAAETHDIYWNAAMREMLLTGYMHNHMRMYWGKKIIEWSPSPQQAFATMLTLNNRYFLCGRDPNSFANVAWCFGLHDRPWPERPVFGKVRSMTTDGLKRKIDVEAYIAHVDHLVEEEAETS